MILLFVCVFWIVPLHLMGNLSADPGMQANPGVRKHRILAPMFNFNVNIMKNIECQTFILLFNNVRLFSLFFFLLFFFFFAGKDSPQAITVANTPLFFPSLKPQHIVVYSSCPFSSSMWATTTACLLTDKWFCTWQPNPGCQSGVGRTLTTRHQGWLCLTFFKW